MLNNEYNTIYAAMLHCVGWNIPGLDRFELGNGVCLCQFEKSKLQQIYEKLCFESGLDDGDPHYYRSYFLVEPQRDRFSFYRDHIDNDISNLCNIIAINFGSSVGMCRVIELNKFLDYIGTTDMSHDYTETTEFLSGASKDITQDSAESIKSMWSSVCLFLKNRNQYKRLYRAFCYFNYAWRGFDFEQVCINLSIVLESLFSPSGSGELSHQISYNVAYFMGTDQNDRIAIYNLIKKFYNVRSVLVHGDCPNNHQLLELSRAVFILCSKILCKILSDSDLIENFSNTGQRRKMFTDWMFR